MLQTLLRFSQFSHWHSFCSRIQMKMTYYNVVVTSSSPLICECLSVSFSFIILIPLFLCMCEVLVIELRVSCLIGKRCTIEPCCQLSVLVVFERVSLCTQVSLYHNHICALPPSLGWQVPITMPSHWLREGLVNFLPGIDSKLWSAWPLPPK
jgi:hypothetical protein